MSSNGNKRVWLGIVGTVLAAVILAGAATVIDHGNRLVKVETDATHVSAMLKRIEKKVDRILER